MEHVQYRFICGYVYGQVIHQCERKYQYASEMWLTINKLESSNDSMQGTISMTRAINEGRPLDKWLTTNCKNSTGSMQGT